MLTWKGLKISLFYGRILQTFCTALRKAQKIAQGTPGLTAELYKISRRYVHFVQRCFLSPSTAIFILNRSGHHLQRLCTSSIVNNFRLNALMYRPSQQVHVFPLHSIFQKSTFTRFQTDVSSATLMYCTKSDIESHHMLKTCTRCPSSNPSFLMPKIGVDCFEQTLMHYCCHPASSYNFLLWTSIIHFPSSVWLPYSPKYYPTQIAKKGTTKLSVLSTLIILMIVVDI